MEFFIEIWNMAFFLLKGSLAVFLSMAIFCLIVFLPVAIFEWLNDNL